MLFWLRLFVVIVHPILVNVVFGQTEVITIPLVVSRLLA
jgi:hypothetical protein